MKLLATERINVIDIVDLRIHNHSKKILFFFGILLKYFPSTFALVMNIDWEIYKQEYFLHNCSCVTSKSD